MMVRSIGKVVSMLLSTCIMSSCYNAGSRSCVCSIIKSDATHFDYDLMGRLVTKIGLHDTLYNAIFDTGAAGVIVDSSIVNISDLCDTVKLSYIFNSQLPSNSLKCNSPIDLYLGNDTIHYTTYYVDNVIEKFGVPIVFSIPRKDKRIWHINYELQELDILDTLPNVPVDSIDIISEIELANEDIHISMDFMFINEKDSINCRLSGILDTGTNKGLVEFGRTENFNTIEMRRFISDIQKYNLNNGSYVCYLYDRDLKNHLKTVFKVNSNHSLTVFGNELLAYFNIYVDMFHKKLYAIKIPNYKHPYEAYSEKNEVNMFLQKIDKGILVDYVAKHSTFCKAGIQRGDIILSIDNIGVDLLSPDIGKQLAVTDSTHKIRIQRDGVILTLDYSR